MQLTYCIGNDSAEPKNGEVLGFVFTCPSCRTPASYQSGEAIAVEMDKKTFENYCRAMDKKISEQEMQKGAVFSKQGSVATLDCKQADESIFGDMLKDIDECDDYDEFLKRIEQ